MAYFTSAIKETKGHQVARFMNLLTEEMLEESQMVPEQYLAHYMTQAAGILFWTATGETIINMPMPDDFRLIIPKELMNNGVDRKALPAAAIQEISESPDNNFSVEDASSLYNRVWFWLRC